jgi:hypothetical protein
MMTMMMTMKYEEGHDAPLPVLDEQRKLPCAPATWCVCEWQTHNTPALLLPKAVHSHTCVRRSMSACYKYSRLSMCVELASQALL